MIIRKCLVVSLYVGLFGHDATWPDSFWVEFVILITTLTAGYMAAAQNVRSGSSPGPTHDPDLRSRPPIQTIRKDLIQTLDPDLWNDIMYW